MEEFPGIFCVFKPKRIELIVNQSEYDIWKHGCHLISDTQNNGDAELFEIMSDSDYAVFEKMQRAVDRGMTLVPVPDNDKDHH